MSPKANNRTVFADAILTGGPSRARAFGAGFALECLGLAILLIVPIFMPHQLEVVAHQWVVPLEAPLVQEWKPQPPQVVKKVVLKQPLKPVEQAVLIPKPKVYDPVIATPVVKRTVVKKEEAPQLVAKEFPAPSLGSSAIPDLKKPREEVQTGGFGDPNSVPDNHDLTRVPNMTAMGGFDMPDGPGKGNGTAGAKGDKGVVASTGFGNGVAAGDPHGSNHGSVQQGSFASEDTSAPQVKRTAAAADRYKPMELLFIPKPQYTDEARAKKIQGDVLVQVVFTASGEVKVLHVIQGLGYGLDEAAESAARQIRFRPAEQDGQPVDVTANIRVKCELAY